MDTKPKIHPLSRAEWREWLAEHHEQTTGVWLVSYKKATGKPRFEYVEAIQEALCFGWIDSKSNTLDAERSMVWFAPRKPKTGWSRVNKQYVEQLESHGLMQPAGQAKVDQARRDGSWNALDGVENLEIPDDLAAAFALYPPAEQYFAAFPRSVKRGILEWIYQAKTPPTRAKRINETAQLAQSNQRANQWRGKTQLSSAQDT